MTRYQGGKKRIGKEIAKQILAFDPNDELEYLEPFVGMCGVMRWVALAKTQKCSGSDLNESLIALLSDVQKGRFAYPEDLCKEDWLQWKNSKKECAMKGYAGLAMSYGGIYFKAFAPDYEKLRDSRNEGTYIAAANKALQSLSTSLGKHVRFAHKSYQSWKPKRCLIYCDPPYKGTEPYPINRLNKEDKFDHDEFWDLMKKWSKNNIVLVSEFDAPKGWSAIWTKTKKIDQRKHRGKRAKTSVEKLFVYDG